MGIFLQWEYFYNGNIFTMGIFLHYQKENVVTLLPTHMTPSPEYPV
jgi:hypothetical protein